MSLADQPPVCPVCRARFRGAAACSRCGADLAPLMRLIVRAASLRSEALDALAAREASLARDLAAHAQTLHATPAGRSLFRLCLFLGGSSVSGER